jgi:hypothetical protein
MRIRALLFIALALAFAQMSFADISYADHGMSFCANLPSSPTSVDYGPLNGGVVLYTQFGCSLYNDVSSYTIDLTTLLTQDSALLYYNMVGAGYLVVINGDPGTLLDDNTGLLNQNLWASVLYWPADQYGAYSDSLSVYWPGAFPAFSDIQTLDDSLYGGPDSSFFIQSTGSETVYAPSAPDVGNVYDVILTPEPGAILMLGAVLLTLAGGIRRRFQ